MVHTLISYTYITDLWEALMGLKKHIYNLWECEEFHILHWKRKENLNFYRSLNMAWPKCKGESRGKGMSVTGLGTLDFGTILLLISSTWLLS